jgi:ribosomal protein S16
VIKSDRALHWLMVGAQPTETVADLLRKLGIMDQLKAARGGTPSAPEAAAEPEA